MPNPLHQRAHARLKQAAAVASSSAAAAEAVEKVELRLKLHSGGILHPAIDITHVCKSWWTSSPVLQEWFLIGDEVAQHWTDEYWSNKSVANNSNAHGFSVRHVRYPDKPTTHVCEWFIKYCHKRSACSLCVLLKRIVQGMFTRNPELLTREVCRTVQEEGIDIMPLVIRCVLLVDKSVAETVVPLLVALWSCSAFVITAHASDLAHAFIAMQCPVLAGSLFTAEAAITPHNRMEFSDELKQALSELRTKKERKQAIKYIEETTHTKLEASSGDVLLSLCTSAHALPEDRVRIALGLLLSNVLYRWSLLRGTIRAMVDLLPDEQRKPLYLAIMNDPNNMFNVLTSELEIRRNIEEQFIAGPRAAQLAFALGNVALWTGLYDGRPRQVVQYERMSQRMAKALLVDAQVAVQHTLFFWSCPINRPGDEYTERCHTSLIRIGKYLLNTSNPILERQFFTPLLDRYIRTGGSREFHESLRREADQRMLKEQDKHTRQYQIDQVLEAAKKAQNRKG